MFSCSTQFVKLSILDYENKLRFHRDHKLRLKLSIEIEH